MPENEDVIPPAPMTVPASPIAREVEAIVERVVSRVIERVDQSNLEVKQVLARLLDEVLSIKRRVEHLEARVTSHDVQIASLTVARSAKKGKRRAARQT